MAKQVHPFCKGNLEEGFTTHTTEIGDTIVIIKGVPCLKCDQCGEVSYTGAVYQRLESIIDSMQNSQTEVVITNYPKVA